MYIEREREGVNQNDNDNKSMIVGLVRFTVIKRYILRTSHGLCNNTHHEQNYTLANQDRP